MLFNRRHTKSTSIVLVLSCLLLTIRGYADSTNVLFFGGTWKQALAQSRQLGKPIFVDIYTTWCAPCKQMEQKVFPNPQVARVFNTNFINYRVDAERGEGKRLQQQFNVTNYPTLLFVDANSHVIYRIAGYNDSDDLVQQANKVVAVSRQLRALTKGSSLSSRSLEPNSVKAYLLELAKLRQPVSELLDRYINKLPADQLTTPDNLAIMAGTVSTTRSKTFDVLLEQWPLMKDTPTGLEARLTMPMAVASDFRQTVVKNDEQAFLRLEKKNKELLQTMGAATASQIDQQLLDLRLDFYRQTKRYDQYHQLATSYVTTQLMNQSIDSLRQQDQIIFGQFTTRVVASDSLRKTADFIRLTERMRHRASESVARKLTGLADEYYISISNPARLAQALSWSQQAITLHAAPFSLTTHAQLRYKLGYRKEAIAEQLKAIEMAKAAGDSTVELEKTSAMMTAGTLKP